MKTVIEVADLSVVFKTDEGEVHAVGGLTFELLEGQILALVGESGCGKSVTAMSILGLLPPSAEVSGTPAVSAATRNAASAFCVDTQTSMRPCVHSAVQLMGSRMA